MAFLGADGQSAPQPFPASWNGHAAIVHSDSAGFATSLATTWPASVASSSIVSVMDSSANGPFEVNLVSSPPTSHIASPPRSHASPLRPSRAANYLADSSVSTEVAKTIAAAPSAVRPEPTETSQADAVVPSSDAEDGPGDNGTDGADTPQQRSTPSPTRSKPTVVPLHSLVDKDPAADASSVYVELPPVSPSLSMPRDTGSAKKKTKKQSQSSAHKRRRGSDASDLGSASTSTVVDDAAYAAALAAQEETLARRRPTRNARKEVSYTPICDADGRPLKGKKKAGQAMSSNDPSSSRSKESVGKARSSTKRRSRVFSDDDEEDEVVEVGRTGPSSKHLQAEKDDDADLTDDDIGFTGRERKKTKKGKQVSLDDGEAEDVAASSKNSRKRLAVDDGGSQDEDDGVLTPPPPGSPRRSSRQSKPLPKKQQMQDKENERAVKTGKGKPQKTFVINDEEDDGQVAGEEIQQPSRKNASTRRGEKGMEMPAPEAKAEVEGEAEQEQEVEAARESAPAAAGAEATSAPTRPPVSVAIKRIGSTSSPAPASPSSSTSSHHSSPSARSFFGKPLTSLLASGAARRPGLTRKTKIPSLLNHRGVPKAPVAQLAASKRRMQDDDYEYDEAYEKLIAKKEKASDDESEDNDKQSEVAYDDEGELGEVEYD